MRRILHTVRTRITTIRTWSTTVHTWTAPIRTWITSASGTYLWLAALFVTTVALHQMSPQFEREFLLQRSTNIHELSTDPVRVLIVSAFWIDGGTWLPYAVLYTVFHAPAEHWLGTPRWLSVAALAHIGATLISEGVLGWAIHHGHAPQSAANTLDVGVSYALAGIAGVLTYRVPRPWHLPYLAAVLIFYGVPLITGRTFTDLGHLASVLIGLACYPLTRACRPRRYLDKRTSSGVRTPT
ncbi:MULTISPECIES: rhomboid-like protein [unclassified Streptomyces]|uniref:rhomboid-like protein n=1 Tax=unclassified Streptomyces TaxID=2593676 RepID=UPI001F387256|nr:MULTISPECIES: rhomboid-like protein [unclassified Streptomyces]